MERVADLYIKFELGELLLTEAQSLLKVVLSVLVVPLGQVTPPYFVQTTAARQHTPTFTANLCQRFLMASTFNYYHQIVSIIL